MPAYHIHQCHHLELMDPSGEPATPSPLTTATTSHNIHYVKGYPEPPS